MTSFVRRGNKLAVAVPAFSIAALWAATAQAQTPVAQAEVQLPGLSVTAPTPIVRTPPPRAAAPQPGTSQAAGSPTPFVPPPGLVEQVFVPLTLVPSQEVLATGGANLADSLQYKPGIAASTFAAGASRPIIRGMDNTRVSVRENGIGSHDASSVSEDHAVPIDPFAADQIEVVRGPATLRYGSGAIGGVVNASNQRIPEYVPRNGFTAEMRGSLASADRSADGAFKATAGAGNFAVHADSFWRRAGDYAIPGGGRQANTFVDSDGFSTGASVIGLGGYAGVSFTQFNSLYGIPGAEALTSRTRIDMQQEKLQSRGEWRVRDYGVEAIRYWLGSSTYRHNEVGFATGTPEIGSRFTNDEIEGRVEVQHLPVATAFGELRGAVGVQLGNRKLTGQSFEGGDSLLDPTRTRTAAAFWFEELQLTRNLRLQAATRIEQTSVTGSGLDTTDPANPVPMQGRRDYIPFSASFGALYQLPANIVARATGQYAERAPDAAELFSKGPHEATTTFEIGNPNLRKEVATSVEVGLKRSQGAFRFDASAYYTAFDGFIFKQLTGQQCDDTYLSCGTGSELNQVFFRQRNAAFHGVELSGQQDIGRVRGGVWGVDAQYDFVRARFTDAVGGNVPRISPHRAGAGLFYRDQNWFARTGFLHAFDQRDIGDNETITKGYTLVNADLSYTWKTGMSTAAATQMTIGLRGDNLLDEDVRNHVSFQKNDVLQPGRTVRLYGIMKLN